MNFSYAAFGAKGEPVGGVIEAATVAEAQEKLRAKGLFVSRVEAAAGESRVKAPRGLAPGPGKLKNVAVFTRQLSILVGAGTPVVDALAALARQAPEGAWRKVLEDVHQRVEGGEALSDAVRAHPRAFDTVCQSLISAGEASGKLDVMLERLSTLARKRQHVRGSVIGAMVYPVLLIGVSMGVIVMLLTTVLPRFSGMFESLDTPLPKSTEVLIVVGDWLTSFWYVPLGLTVGLGVGGVAWVRSAPGRRVFDAAAVRAPVVGPIVRNFATAQLARLMGTLLESKVPMLEAISLTRAAAFNDRYRTLLEDTEKAVTQGEPVSRVLGASPLIAPAVCEALRSGEHAGNIGPVLTHVAGFIEEDNDVVVRSLASLLEPVILITLGVIVAVITTSMFLPMFDLAASAGRAS